MRDIPAQVQRPIQESGLWIPNEFGPVSGCGFPLWQEPPPPGLVWRAWQTTRVGKAHTSHAQKVCEGFYRSS
jgi:hypothetical protein